MTAIDDALSQFNQVASTASRLPGIGAPKSSASTDAQNRSVAGAMDRADAANRVAGFGSQQFGADASEDALRARRDPNALVESAIDLMREAKNQDSIAGGVDPARPALYLNPKEQDRLMRASAARATAKGLAYRAAKDIATMDDVGDFYAGMKSIDKFPEGSPERHDAIVSHVRDHPLAYSTSGVQSFLKQYAFTHDAAANLYEAPDGMEVESVSRDDQGKTRVSFKRPNQGTYESKAALLEENPNANGKQNARGQWYDAGESKTAAGKSSSDKARETLEHGLLTKYGITPDDFANPVSVKAGKKEDGKFTNQYSGAEKGDTFSIETSKGEILMPRKDFDYFKRLHEATAGSETAKAASSISGEITSQEAYDALPPGSRFVWKGKHGEKPAK